MRALFFLSGGCIVLLSVGFGPLVMFFITLAVILVFKWINKPERVFTAPDRASAFSIAFSNIAKQGYTGYSVDTECVSERGMYHGTFGRKHDVCGANALARIGHIHTGE